MSLKPLFSNGPTGGASYGKGIKRVRKVRPRDEYVAVIQCEGLNEVERTWEPASRIFASALML